MEKKMLLV